MFRLKLAIATLSLFIPATAFAGWRARILDKSDAKKVSGVDLVYQDGRIRIDTPERSIVIKLAAGEFFVLWHRADKKEYATGDIESLGKMFDQRIPARVRDKIKDLPLDPGQIVASGKKKKVAGFDCEIYDYKARARTGEICLAQSVGLELGTSLQELRALAQRLSKRLGLHVSMGGFELSPKPLFPLQLREDARREGQPPSLRELESITAVTVPASSFEIPAGYNRRYLPQ